MLASAAGSSSPGALEPRRRPSHCDEKRSSDPSSPDGLLCLTERCTPYPR